MLKSQYKRVNWWIHLKEKPKSKPNIKRYIKINLRHSIKSYDVDFVFS